MSIYLRNIIRFILLILIQVLLLNKIPLNWWAPPYIGFVYPLFILLLPVSTPKSYVLLFSFALGITMDAFMNTGGLNAMACVLMGFARLPVLKFFLPEPLREYKMETPGPRVMQWSAFLAYAAVLLFIHIFTYTFVEIWSLKSLGYFVTKAFVSFVTSILFVIVYLLIFTRSVNSRAYD